MYEVALDAASKYRTSTRGIKGRASSRPAYRSGRELSKLNRNIVSRQRRGRTLIALMFAVLGTRGLER